ncbi:MAG: hypothetical protein JWN52_6712 [Actinomycetia bacterium]|nr:hypothetical protein [Actinomycetes bacterium]
MTVTVGKEEAVRQPATATDAGEADDSPQLARARDGIVPQILAVLPDTESVRRVWDGFLGFWDRVWSGEVWDIQPPSPRELVDRVRTGPWATSDERVLRFLAWTGLTFCVAWSVFWYSVAVAGQKFWRLIVAVLVTVLIYNML